MKITKTEIIIGVVIVIVLGVGIFYAASRKKALVGSLVFGGSGAQSGAVASPVSRSSGPFSSSCPKYTSIDTASKDPGKVCYLDLYNTGLTAIPSNIASFANLQSLNVADNDITSLPPELFTLTNLQTLYVGNNKLAEIPSGIGNLTNLSFFSAINNQLTSLPPEIKNLKQLNMMFLTDNNINPSEQSIIRGWFPLTAQIVF